MPRKDDWFIEEHTDHTHFYIQIKELLYEEQTPYQLIQIFDSIEYGRMLVLNDALQITEYDEFAYAEMMAHVPLHAHPNPEQVLVIGGGDGGTVREASRFPSVKRVVMAEIDQAVINASLQYIPSVSGALKDNPKLEFRIGDAVEYIKQVTEEFDVIIVDSSDPVDIAEGLFTHQFYQDVYKALKPGGMVSVQGESPWIHRALVKRIVSHLSSIFPIASLYYSNIPTYPSGIMVFPIGSKGNDPSVPVRDAIEGLRYYTSTVHKGAFMLPRHLQPEHMEAGPENYHWD